VFVVKSKVASQLRHFVGRGEEISFFQEKLHVARRRGTGSALLIGGRSGVGKSRLLQRYAELAASSATVLYASCTGSDSETTGLSTQLAKQVDLVPDHMSTRSTEFLLDGLRCASKRRPVVVLIDDIQVAEMEELELLDSLIAETAQSRLVAVGTFEQPAALPPRTLAPMLGRWRSKDALIVTLEPLSAAQVGLLMRSCGLSPARAGSRDQLQDFIRLSGGNPRYIADLIQEGSLKSLTGHTTPYSARAIVSTLVLTMTTEQFEVLSAAAIVGDRFSGEWLRAACRRDDETIASALQAALDRGIISESPHQHSFYTFTDNAVRRALYLSVVEFKRRIVHREVAVYLTERSNEEVTDAVAEHWDASGDLQKATTWLTRAAGAAANRRDYRVAANLYERAAVCCEQYTNDGLELWQRAAACYQEAGAYQSALPICESIVAKLQDCADPERLANALRTLGHAYWWTGQQEKAVQTTRVLQSLSSPATCAMISRATVACALRLCRNGAENEAAITLSTVRRCDLDRASKPWFLLVSAMAWSSSRKTRSAIAKAQAAANLAQRTMPPQPAGWLLMEVSNFACRTGQLSVAMIEAERAAKCATGSEETDKLKLWTTILGAELNIHAGQLPLAHALLLSLTGVQDAGPLCEANLAALAVLIGLRIGDRRLIDAFFNVQTLQDAIEDGQVDLCGMLLEGFPEVMVARGMSYELDQLLERCALRRFVDPTFSIQLAIAAFGSLDYGQSVLTELRRRRDGSDADLAAATLPLAEALIARRSGTASEVKTPAAQAAAALRKLGWKLREALSLELSGDNNRARSLYQACGAKREALRLSVGRTRKQARAYFGARLTLREQEVAKLACNGAINAAIAESLGISERTVHHHLEAIFSKLGVRARWQLSHERIVSP
jgi:DNA-binding CsgD family transcriptional regulator